MHLFLPFQDLSSRLANAPNLVGNLYVLCPFPFHKSYLISFISLTLHASSSFHTPAVRWLWMIPICLSDTFPVWVTSFLFGWHLPFEVSPPLTLILGHTWIVLMCSNDHSVLCYFGHPFVGKPTKMSHLTPMENQTWEPHKRYFIVIKAWEYLGVCFCWMHVSFGLNTVVCLYMCVHKYGIQSVPWICGLCIHKFNQPRIKNIS